jgi:uncharacterized membrane protein
MQEVSMFTDDLSKPRGTTLSGSRPDPELLGKGAEGIASFLGTAKFIFGQTVFIIVWIALNTTGYVHHWDKEPFVLLNLAFSVQAAYAAPLILLAQKRQDIRDKASIELDRKVANRTQDDGEYVARELASVRLSLTDVLTRDDLQSELRSLVRSLSALSAEVRTLTHGDFGENN